MQDGNVDNGKLNGQCSGTGGAVLVVSKFGTGEVGLELGPSARRMNSKRRERLENSTPSDCLISSCEIRIPYPMASGRNRTKPCILRRRSKEFCARNSIFSGSFCIPFPKKLRLKDEHSFHSSYLSFEKEWDESKTPPRMRVAKYISGCFERGVKPPSSKRVGFSSLGVRVWQSTLRGAGTSLRCFRIYRLHFLFPWWKVA